MNIETMMDSDIEEVGNVFLKTFNNFGEDWNVESAVDHIRQNYFGNAHWIVREEGKIVGFIMGIILVHEHGPELFIDSIAVLPEYQKRGVGQKLWNKAEQFAQEENLHAIRFLSNKSFNSYQWYKSMGFAESGWVEMFKKIKS